MGRHIRHRRRIVGHPRQMCAIGNKAEAGAQLSEGRNLLELLVADGDAQALLQLGLQLDAGEAIEMQVAVEAAHRRPALQVECE